MAIFHKYCCYTITEGVTTKLTTKSLGVCYWCVKIQQCGYMELGLKHITFYVPKHIASLAMCYNLPPVRDKSLGAPASVELVYWYMSIFVSLVIEIWTCQWTHLPIQTLYVLNSPIENASAIYIIPPHWHGTGSWNPSSCKTRIYLFCIVNIIVADALAPCVAKASATMILAILNWNNSVPTRSGYSRLGVTRVA